MILSCYSVINNICTVLNHTKRVIYKKSTISSVQKNLIIIYLEIQTLV